MSDKFKVRYDVEDGYVSGSRPQYFTLSADWIDEEMTDDELEGELNDIIQENFMQRISWHCNNRAEVLEWARNKRDEKAKEAGE